MNKDIKKVIKKNQYRSKFYREYKSKEHKSSPPIKTQKSDENNNSSSRVMSYINKVLISATVFLFLLICKNDHNLNFIYKATFSHLNFAKIDAFFMSQFNSLFPKTTNDDLYVNDIVINIDNSRSFKDGVIVETEPFLPIQSHTEGIVIRIYQDDELGQVVVVQNIEGHEYHYGFLNDVKVTLYSRIQYGETIGIGKTTEDLTGEFYLAITNNNTYLDVVELVNNEG